MPVDLVSGVGEVRSRLDAALKGTAAPILVGSVNVDHVRHWGRFGPAAGELGAHDPRWWWLIDGAPIATAARRRTGRSWPRLTGADLLTEVLAAAHRAGARVGVVGTTPEAMARFRARVAVAWPGLAVTTWSPPRAVLADPAARESLVAEIAAAGVEVVVTTLPKRIQEPLLEQIAGAAPIRVGSAFGAAVDYLAGTRRRAPRLVRRARAEWAWRLACEPRRLFRRYVLEGPGAWWSLWGPDGPLSAHEVARRFGRRLAVADGVVLVAAMVAAYLARHLAGRRGWLQGLDAPLPLVVGAVPALWAGLVIAGAWRSRSLRVDGEHFRRLAAGVAIGVGILGFVSFALEARLARGYVGALALAALGGGAAVRVALMRWIARARRSGRWRVRTLVVGGNGDAARAAGLIAADPNSGLWCVGVEMAVDDVVAAARARRAGLVVMCADTEVARHEMALAQAGIDLALAPVLDNLAARRVNLEPVAGAPFALVEHVRLTGPAAALKRTIDIVGATIGLVLAAPVLAVCALAIWFDDGRPIWYSGERIGRDGRPFRCHKLRTMVVDADRRRAEVGADGVMLFKRADDPRLLRTGRFLRRWSLDELPQLVNVLTGEMSLVGPRPALASEVDGYATAHRRRLWVRPGVTGLWQVSGRSDLDFERAVGLDTWYVANWSIGLDLAILARTVVAVVSRRGAV